MSVTKARQGSVAGVQGGYAPLDSGLLVPVAYLPDVANLATAETDTSKYLVPDGTGGVDWRRNPLPDVAGYTGTYDGSTASTVVTTSAFAVGTPLIAVSYSVSRGCNSITQTNVTWTQRYSNSGNSRFIQVWTGVVAGGAAGTSATFAFTGANAQFCEIFYFADDTTAWTTVAENTSTTAASGTLCGPISASATPGASYLWLATSQAASSYSGGSHPYRHLSATGGQGRGGAFRSINEAATFWSVQASSVAYFMTLVKLT